MAQPNALQNTVTETQCGKILAFLQAGNSLTAIDALNKFSCNRLAARINDLRKQGYSINSRLVVVLNREGASCRVAEYSLVEGGDV